MKDSITAGAATHGVIVFAERLAFLARVVKWAAEHDSEDAANCAVAEMAKEMVRLGECAVHLFSAVTDVDIGAAAATLPQFKFPNTKVANDPPGS